MARLPRLRFALLALPLAGAAAGCVASPAARLYHDGTAALDRGDAARAVSDLERAAALAPELSAIQNHLGLAYQDAGRAREALRAFERAVELDCGNEAALRNREALRARARREGW